MAYIRLPDNSYFKVPENSTPEAAMQVAQQKYPKAFMSEKELEDKQGFGAAVGEAFRGAKAAGYEGAGKLFGSEALKKASEEEYRKLREEPGFIPTTAEDREAAFKKGIFSGIGALGREYISEPVGGIVGRYGAPIAAGALATAAAPVTGVGALGAGVIGGAVTAAADYLPQVGENLERQREKGKPENLTDASLAAIPQAALSGLNLRLGMLPKGIQNIFKADAAALQKQVVSGALKPEAAVSQLSGNLKNILLSTGSAAVVGTGTMVGEEAIRRAQAGQSVADAEALGDYGTMAKDAALLAPLFGVPRGALKRRGEVKGIEAAGRQRADVEGVELRAKQDAEAALAAEDAFRAEQASTIGPKEDAAAGVQGRTGDLFAETYRTEGPAKGKEAFGKMEGDVSPLPGISDNLTVAERERQAQARGVETQTPFEAKRQRDLLAKRVEQFETQIAAAASKGDINTITGLNEQLVQSRNALKEAEVAAKAAGPIEMSPAQQLEKLQADLAKSTKELQKAGDLGDFDKIAALTPKLKDLQTKIAEIGQTGPDLFAVDKNQRIGEEIQKYEAEVSARGEDVQRTTAQQKQAKAKADYEAKQKELEEAFANGAEEPIINRLVAEVESSRKGMASNLVDSTDVNALESRAQNLADLRSKIKEEEYGYTATETGLRQAVEARDQLNAEKQPLLKQRDVLSKRISELGTRKSAAQEVKTLTAQLAEVSEKLRAYAAQTGVASRKVKDIENKLTQSQENVWSLKNQLASEVSDAAGSRPEVRRDKALEEQKEALGDLYTELQDYASSGKVLGLAPQRARTEALNAIGRYVAASIREVNAVRDANRQKQLTKTEATRLAVDLRSWAERALNSKNPDVIKIGKGGVSPMEKQLAQLKSKYLKGESKLQRGPEGLRQEVDVEAAKLRRGEKAESGTPYETPERKKERLADEASETERVARSGVNPDQRSLFSEKELPPIATYRATPANFMRLLRSFNVYAMQDKLTSLEKKVPTVEKVKKRERIEEPRALAQEIETQKRAVVETREVHQTFKGLTQAFNRVKAEAAKYEKSLATLKQQEVEVTRDATQGRVSRTSRDARGGDARVREAKKRLGEIRENIKETEKSLAELGTKKQEYLDFRQRYASILASSVELERALLKDLESLAAKNRPNKTAEAASRARLGVLESLEKQNKDQQNKDARVIEQTRREKLANIPGVKQEIIAGKRVTQNTKELAREKKLRSQLALEKGKADPDPKRISEIQNELARIETTFVPETITRKTPIQPESVDARVEKQRRAQKESAEDLLGRKETKSNPLFRSARDAEIAAGKLRKQRDTVRKQIATDNNKFNKLQEKLETAKGARREGIQTQMDLLELAIKDKGLVAKEAKLSKQYNEIAAERPGLMTEALRADAVAVTGADPSKKVSAPKKKARTEKLPAELELDNLLRDLPEDGSTYRKIDPLRAEYKGRSGTDYRLEAPVAGTRVDATLAKQVSDAIEKNAPKDVNLKSVDTFAELPPAVKKLMERDGIVDGSAQSQSVRGFVTPDGDVYVIRGNHESVKDMERTYVHEIIGHAGVDRILGKEGMESLTKRVNAQGGAMELARKLGVEDNVQGAMNDYALTVAKMTRDGASKADIDKTLKDMETQAVRELLAYTAEKRVDENFKQKAGRWVQEVIGAVRAALRKMGLMEMSKVSTADIFNILRQSQKNYNKGQLGAFRDTNGNMAFRSQPIFNSSISDSEASTISKVIARDKPFKDRIKGNAIGMSFMHRFADRFAGLDYIARTMRDKLEGVQMMYYNRLYDQRNNMIAEIATHGSVGLERNNDGSYQYKSRKGPSLKNVFESVNKAKSEFGNAQATLDYFGTYLAMERAASNKGGLKAGLEKLDLSGKISEAEANAILKKGRANANFQEARKSYREYNNGMIDLMVESGRLSKEQAVELKKGDYVPYYRDKGGEIIDTENNIRVGDIKTQAYLKELIGGDSAIVNFETGALQNTYMLTDMAMSNIAAKNTAYTLSKLGMAEVKNGSGSAKSNIIRFYENGVQKHAEVNTRGNYLQLEERLDKMRASGKANTPEYKKLRERAEASRASESAFGDIPADMIVKGMEGVTSAMPAGVAMMRGPANLLRKAVTRNPAYAVRIALKDSLSGWITSGADVKPFVSIMGGIKKSWQGDAPEVRSLQSQGIIGGHAFAGTMSDMRTIAQQIAQGQSGWEKLWAKADRMAIMADEAQRVSLYNGFIKKGMSEMEATLATLESANFTKHGYSPTVKALSTMIPFFNAQIQGINVFARAISGTSLFQDKLGVREAMLKRGMMLAGATMAYSALMQNNEAYKNATETDKLNYWFVPLPFMDEPVRVPIPFEAGAVFKAIPEAIYNLMASDSKSKDVLPAVGRLALNSIPGMSNMFLPQGIKPVIELTTGTSFFTLEGIESARQKAELPGYRSGTNTTELSKALGKALNVSPIQIDYAINGYTSGLGIALLSMFNPLLRDASAPESKSSQLPIVGGFFQPTDGTGLINKAYEDMQSIEQVNRTFKNLEEKDPDQADKFLDKYIDKIDKVSAAGKFKKEMGDLNKEERMIRSDTSLTAAQKRAELDEIRQIKIEIAKEFMSISRE